MELFRSESTGGTSRLHGDVRLAPPLSWQMIGFSLAAMLAVALLFLCFGRYGEHVSARGWVTSDRGVMRVSPPRAGTLAALVVREGTHVRKGQRLARVAFATAAGADTLESRRATAARQQAAALAERPAALMAASGARLEALGAQLAAENAEQGQIDGRIAEQAVLLASAEEDLVRTRDVAARGFVSRNDMRLREEARAQRHQLLLQLQQERVELAARIAVTGADARRERADLAIARLDVTRAQGELSGQAAADAAQPWLDVVAPADGIVTGIDGAPGLSVDPGRPLLSIIPTGSQMLVRLAVPADGAGSIRPGQPIAVALDAYPREIFGTLAGRITYVTASTVPVAGTANPAFVAEARLVRPFLLAFGARQPLRPGMSLTAMIVTRRLSLIRWLLDPLYAVMER